MSLVNEKIIKKMNIYEKIAFCSGATFWSTAHDDELGIPEMILTDGPHGVRMQRENGDPSGLYDCFPATCFPTACALAATWNKELAHKMGEALGLEAASIGSDLILGPGVNIKRNPLCGRNFEYFSEDPYVTGKMGSELIKGIQSTGIGACAKHFCGNNQETDRLIVDDYIDERALREIYLAAFEMIAKEAAPDSMMASYNKLDGESVTNNMKITRHILRDEWNYKGMLMSDWGAINDRVKSLNAGVDLEMPTSNGFYEKKILEALKTGTIKEQVIDEAVDRILSIIFKDTKDKTKKPSFDIKKHNELACEIAADAGVLLKNDGILPLNANDNVALIGGMAENIRFQGSGSSHICPTMVTDMVEAFKEKGVSFKYFKGYEKQDIASESLLKEAVEGASIADCCVVVIGLSDAYESEGYDRKNMDIPPVHRELLKKIYEVNKNIVVVLLGGSPVLMDWDDNARAVLNMYLAGQAAGMSAARLLYGDVNPSGKLPESYPESYEDVVCSNTFAKEARQAFYDESIYVGYRYYEKAGVKVKYPFGFGLSYTSFTYSDLVVETEGYDVNVSAVVENSGKLYGGEVVELYVGNDTGFKFTPVKELKGFEKVYLNPGEKKTVQFTLNKRSFSYYDEKINNWSVVGGKYKIMLGSSSNDIRLETDITLSGADVKNDAPNWYNNPSGKPDRTDFYKLIGHEILPYRYPVPGEFTPMTPLCDMQMVPSVKKFTDDLISRVSEAYKNDLDNPELLMEIEQLLTAPMQALYLQAHLKLPFEEIEELVKNANASDADQS